MISATRIRPYKYLAEFYDQLFGHFDDARDAERQAAIGSIPPRLHSARHLACGSAHNSGEACQARDSDNYRGSQLAHRAIFWQSTLVS